MSLSLWISVLSYVKSTYLLELWVSNDLIALKFSNIIAVVLFKYSKCYDQNVSPLHTDAFDPLILSCVILPVQKVYAIFGMYLLPEEVTF